MIVPAGWTKAQWRVALQNANNALKIKTPEERKRMLQKYDNRYKRPDSLDWQYHDSDRRG